MWDFNTFVVKDNMSDEEIVRGLLDSLMYIDARTPPISILPETILERWEIMQNKISVQRMPKAKQIEKKKEILNETEFVI